MQPPTEHLDAAIIGAGQGGVPLAEAFANAGWNTVLIERAFVGGTCVNYGCTPTKTMIASAEAADWVRRAGAYGVQAGAPIVDLTAVRQRKRDIVTSFREHSREHLERVDGLELIHGEASFSAPHALSIREDGGGQRTLEAETIVIDTGARPSIPDIKGIDDVPTLDSTSIMELNAVPEHVAVLGGGYVGVEFAQMLRRLGAAVSLIEMSNHVLSREDHDISEVVEQVLGDEGVTVRTGFTVKYVEKTNGKLRIVGAQGARGLVVLCTHILIATGRVPNTDQLGLKSAGIDTADRGHVVVDERLETSVPGVYAIGDVNGNAPFTHISYDDYRILRDNLLDRGDCTTTDRLVPYVVYTDPQLARVGLTQRQADEQGLRYRVAKMPMSHVARALETERTAGVLKALVDEETDRILGATVLGAEGGEMMSIIHLAMLADLPYTALRDVPFAHPTFAEALNNLFSSWSDE